MADDHTHDELAQLRALVETLQANQAALRAEQHRPRRRLPRRFLPLALVALLVVLTPLATFAAGFTDLNTGSPHNDNIAAIAAVGITKGCNPPDYTQYCPNGLVTREEMASFLARTAGLGSNPPVVNAKTAQTVPDGTVTAAKLSNSGATPGQVLTATNAGVAWQTAPSSAATAATLGVHVGAVNPDGTSQGGGFSSTRTGSGSYTIVFPAGSFPPSSVGRFPFIVAMPVSVSTITVLNNQGHTILADGSSYFTITFTGDTLFNFIVAPGQ